MTSILPLVSRLVVEGLTKTARPVLPHLNGKGLVLGVVAAIMAVQGSTFALVSLYLYLQLYVSAINAGLIVAGLLVFGAICLALAGRGVIRRHGLMTYHRSFGEEDIADDFVQPVKELLEIVVAEMEDPVRENPKMTIALAGLAGYLAGDFYRRRK